VIVGFLGGRDAWNDKTKGVRQVGLSLTDPARNWYAENPRVWALVDDLIRAACRGDELKRVVIGPKK
jgi:hypothetical protein